jgi:lysozyme family protein
MTPLEVLIGRVLDREGGIADAGDGKGVTYFGQTTDWLAQFNLTTPRTRDDAALNYLTWVSLTSLTPIVVVGDDLADAVLDIAVMSSAPKAIKALQTTLRVVPDGVVGVVTLAMLAKADRKQLARDVIAWDMSYQGRLITLDPTRAKYAAGWSSRMAEHVRRLV